ncbi:unnamed protein product [Didymodactylos carnosus]|uniref:Uncharacterized protein n=1 Tax=Didymodactylos carnosus TaxID=1234261 RepID=A0A815UXB5_9BILA|nr:unnamed protein product [Didymodactylos carnosus]CAF1522200.1 unnamed protein product [Didymodactylos carnosus]CAF4241564.1 unnamed protein product [Didymodactylos carnosus]CAF4381342.1 unnamed protein product [Didymodactylos carnosus]
MEVAFIFFYKRFHILIQPTYYLGLLLSPLFILIQVTYTIDFGYIWGSNWLDKYENQDSKKHAVAYIVCMILFYCLALSGIILLFIFYTDKEQCQLNILFISLHLVFCIFSSIISILPCVKNHNPASDVFQSSIISFLITFNLWSALNSYSQNQCRPRLISIATIYQFSLSIPNNIKFLPVGDPIYIVGIVLCLLTILYCLYRNDCKRYTRMVSENTNAAEVLATEEVQTDDEEVLIDTELQENNSTINHDFYVYLVLACGTIYVMMLMTNWSKPLSDNETFHYHNASYWVKIVSSWLCHLLYIWSCIAPTVLQNRYFY